MEWIIGVLALTNIATLVLYFRKKVKLSERQRSILGALEDFEREGNCLLEINRINPENVYLRSPAGRV